MRAPIRWREAQPGRIVALLGDVEIGVVIIQPGAKRDQAAWVCWLPPAPAYSLRPARDLDRAKAALAERVTDWLGCAGLVTAAEMSREVATARQARAS